MVDNDGQPDPLVLNLSKYYTSPSKRGKSPVRRVVKKQKMANLNNNDLFGTSTAASDVNPPPAFGGSGGGQASGAGPATARLATGGGQATGAGSVGAGAATGSPRLTTRMLGDQVNGLQNDMVTMKRNFHDMQKMLENLQLSHKQLGEDQDQVLSSAGANFLDLERQEMETTWWKNEVDDDQTSMKNATDTLLEKYNRLENDHKGLREAHNELVKDHNELLTAYNATEANVQDLAQKHGDMDRKLDEIVKTLNEVKVMVSKKDRSDAPAAAMQEAFHVPAGAVGAHEQVEDGGRRGSRLAFFGRLMGRN